MKLTIQRLAALGILLLLPACGASGDGPMAPGSTDGGNNGNTSRTIKSDPSFNTDVYEIFQRRGCTASSCHGGGQGGLTMTSSAQAYANLVNVAAFGKAGEVRVIPSNAEASYLVKKLEGASGIVGVQMPYGMTPLDATDLANVKNWINQGAKNN